MAERSINSPQDSQESMKLDAKIARALASAPQPDIPADFAARIAIQALRTQGPPMDAPMPAPSRYGRNTAIVCVAILLALISLAARHTAASPVWYSIESLLCLQLALISIGLTVRTVSWGSGWFS